MGERRPEVGRGMNGLTAGPPSPGVDRGPEAAQRCSGPARACGRKGSPPPRPALLGGNRTSGGRPMHHVSPALLLEERQAPARLCPESGVASPGTRRAASASVSPSARWGSPAKSLRATPSPGPPPPEPVRNSHLRAVERAKARRPARRGAAVSRGVPGSKRAPPPDRECACASRETPPGRPPPLPTHRSPGCPLIRPLIHAVGKLRPARPGPA